MFLKESSSLKQADSLQIVRRIKKSNESRNLSAHETWTVGKARPRTTATTARLTVATPSASSSDATKGTGSSVPGTGPSGSALPPLTTEFVRTLPAVSVAASRNAHSVWLELSTKRASTSADPSGVDEAPPPLRKRRSILQAETFSRWSVPLLPPRPVCSILVRLPDQAGTSRVGTKVRNAFGF